MKQTLTLFAAILLLAVGATAQKLSYQAVVRNDANELVAGATVQVAVSILNATGNVQYAENHANVQTNLNGLLSLMIGDGTPTGTATMADIVWTGASVKTIITLPGGASVTSVTPVNAVPYALYADNVDPSVVEDAVTDYIAAHGAGGEANVQADWSVTDPTSDAYIQNKPTNVSSFDNDANYITAADIPAIPTVPADVSAFNNDANYITNTGSCANSVNLCDLLEKLELLENQIQPIMILTGGVTEVSTNSFTVNGKVLTNGSTTITQRGFVYATSHNPTLDNNSVNNGSGTGEYTSTITELTAGTTYFVRAFATNVNGTYYGNEVAITTTATTPSVLPSVTTITVTNVATSEATVRGAVTSDGGENVTQRGFVYGTEPNLSIASSSIVYHGTGVGQYVNLLSSLLSGQTYYVRAFATNNVGTAYGDELTFTTSTPSPVAGDAVPCPETPTVTDHEGNVYNTVQIGTQCWTKENMRATTSPSTGTYLIPPAGTSETFAGKQARWYDDDSATYAPRNYGLLYNWNAAMDTFNIDYGELSVNPVSGEFWIGFTDHRRGICPQGWHVPSDAEWTSLFDYLNAHEEYRSGNNAGYIGKALASNIGWNTSSSSYAVGNNQNENNLTGFSAIPAGHWEHWEGSWFWDSGTFADFWSTWDNDWHPELADLWRLDAGRPDIEYLDNPKKSMGLSVRCLRDENSGGDTPGGNTPSIPVGDAQPCPGTPTVTDHEGNVYNTVQIGDQCWTKENMRCTTSPKGYLNLGGTASTSATSPYVVSTDTAYYYNWDNLDIPLVDRGMYYNWAGAMDTTAETHITASFTGRRGICPEGWHVPSYEEWNTLTSYVGNQSAYQCNTSNAYVAKALASTNYWNTSSNPCAVGNESVTNNTTGLSIVPAGYFYFESFFNQHAHANMWSSTSYSGEEAAYRTLTDGAADVNQNGNYKSNGRSVRCLRDY